MRDLHLRPACSMERKRGNRVKPMAVWSASLLALMSGLASAQQLATEHVVVLGALPGSDIGLSSDRLPAALQSFDASQITAQRGGSLLAALGSQTAGVSL